MQIYLNEKDKLNNNFQNETKTPKILKKLNLE
jgi:hypothetical protein